MVPLWSSGGGEGDGGGLSRWSRRGAGGRWLLGARHDVRGEPLMMTCGRGHLCSRGASLAHEVAKATREVRVLSIDGGHFRL